MFNSRLNQPNTEFIPTPTRSTDTSEREPTGTININTPLEQSQTVKWTEELLLKISLLLEMNSRNSLTLNLRDLDKKLSKSWVPNKDNLFKNAKSLILQFQNHISSHSENSPHHQMTLLMNNWLKKKKSISK